MRSSTGKVLREAVKEQRSNETFERALSRMVKKHHGTYPEYIDLIGKVRERAEKGRVPLHKAAEAIASEE